MKGYYHDVVINNAPDDLVITTKDNVTIPVRKRLVHSGSANPYATPKSGSESNEMETFINLRSSEKHTLTLSSQGKEYNITVYPRLSFGWFVLDAVLVFPTFVDYYTGNWNYFDSITYQTQ